MNLSYIPKVKEYHDCKPKKGWEKHALSFIMQ
jgi:hypothetical protein